MCVVRALVVVVLFACICLLAVTAEENSNETDSDETPDRNVTSGKTYFIQLKKILTGGSGDDGDDNDKQYVKINHYRTKSQDGVGGSGFREVHEEEFVRRKYHDLYSVPQVAENIREATFEDVKSLERKRNPSRIDGEWVLNTNRSVYDLPNITQEIYEAMLENNKDNSVVNASTVKFFFEKDINLSSNIVRFNIESLVNSSDVIVDAELHVYRLPRENNTVRVNATENVVRLFQMTENPESAEDDDNTTVTPAPDVHKLANVIYISSGYEGWQVFKVKTVVDNWRNGDDNLGFLISTVDAHDREDTVEFAHRERNGGKYQPTLIVYLDRQMTPNRKSIVRRVRKPFRPIRRGDVLPLNPCRRHVWYLSFHELGWNNFIIAPSGFMAYKCDGSCRSPTASTFTNHGKLLSINEGRAGDALMPCCVPSSYKSILIMFYDKESNVVIKEYEDMVVNSCGCR